MSDVNPNTTVLVTGGTGFLGVHCILQLLNRGYRVKTTLRTPARKQEVLEMLRNGGVDASESLSFVQADLSSDTNWDEAVRDCTYVLHVASPISLAIPRDENELIRPAVDGTLRVLRAAKKAGVKRVVVTSSFAAVGYSHNDPNVPITEECWTDPDEKNLSAYLKSKTLAERAAWDFVNREGQGLELAVVNPVGIFGPSLGPDLSSGFEVLQRLLSGSMRSVPRINFGIVDVRDVADLHLRAMTAPEATGQRFLAVAGDPMSLPEIAQLLRRELGDHAARVSTKVMPNWVVKVAALFNPLARNVAPQLGKAKNASNAKAKKLLGWSPRTNKEAIMASVESMVRFGAIKL